MEPAKSASLAIAEKALQWMPESLRRVLSRNMDSLRNGIDEVHGAKFLMASDRLPLEENLLQRMTSTVQRLQSRPKFSEAAKDFGAIAQMILLLNLPENEAGSGDKLLSFTDVIGRNTQAFRVVVYDASEIGESLDEVRPLLDTARQRRKRLSEPFAVEATRLARSTIALDPRAALYGIAALVYSHAINDTARAWLWIWRSANGDMSGRPSLQAQP
ncbi:MAG TPA: hypothetical protein VFJ27_09340 [Terriglobia bacterium]|nr:hypothetical protein [Terriglobia bacterium]